MPQLIRFYDVAGKLVLERPYDPAGQYECHPSVTQRLVERPTMTPTQERAFAVAERMVHQHRSRKLMYTPKACRELLAVVETLLTVIDREGPVPPTGTEEPDAASADQPPS